MVTLRAAIVKLIQQSNEIDSRIGWILTKSRTLEQSTLWLPSGLHVAGGRLYAFTSRRAAYALQLER